MPPSHIDIAEVWTEEGKLYMLVAIDRVRKATVGRYYNNHKRLQTHLATFLKAYNYAKRLKALNGLTPFKFICKAWTEEPQRFRLDPAHHMPGLNI
jgi:hypothetical protein